MPLNGFNLSFETWCFWLNLNKSVLCKVIMCRFTPLFNETVSVSLPYEIVLEYGLQVSNN